MIDLIFDIESLGGPGSVVLSVGMWHVGADYGTEIYIDPEQQLSLGLKIDLKTVLWWIGQPAKTLPDACAYTTVFAALQQIRKFITNAHTCAPDHDVCIWGRGAGFDRYCLESLYTLAGQAIPWHPQQWIDSRLLDHLFTSPAPRSHDALQDCQVLIPQVRAFRHLADTLHAQRLQEVNNG